jgi:hypothetical protein
MRLELLDHKGRFPSVAIVVVFWKSQVFSTNIRPYFDFFSNSEKGSNKNPPTRVGGLQL